MTSINQPDFTGQIDALLLEYEQLRARAKFPDLSDLKVESQAFVTRLRSAIERIAPGSNAYSKEMHKALGYHATDTATLIRIYLGILSALRSDIAAGWLEGLVELLHADTFGEFLEQAEELASKNFKDAAAVIAGSTLETHLRGLCDKTGIPVQSDSGYPKKADAMNADLVKASIYNTLQQKAITGWLAIRNSAAHGKYSEYDKTQVVAMIAAVRDFIDRYPA